MTRDELFEKNMAYFEKANAGLHLRMTHYTPHGELVFDEDDEPDIALKEKRLYEIGAQKYADLQWERYWRDPARLGIKPLGSDSVDDEGKIFLNHMLRRAVDEEIVFDRYPTSHRSFHVICLGLGLGAHLERLSKETQCRNMLIIEPNFEFVYQSLYTFDWQAFAEGFADQHNSRFHLITAPRPEGIIHEIRYLHRLHGVCFFDGTVVFEHYQSSTFTAVQKFLSTGADMMVAGIGFLEDELNMTANTYRNLVDGRERVFEKFQIEDRIAAFIVGSGPSLDQDIETVKALADRAIVISCGTSLAPLLRAGVKPDFHVEMERGIPQVVFPKELRDEGHDLSDICLVSSTTLLPESRGNFPRRVFFFREQLSSFAVFSGNSDNIFKYPSPTVVNTGFSFAQDMGISNFYLFGVDLGFRDSNQHHSGGTQYDAFHMGADRSFSGNFGGTFHSTFVFGWAKDSLENAMKAINMGRIFYNCSDGSRIEGTIPKLSDQIELPELTRPKRDIVDDIIGHFPVYSRQRFEAHWKDGALIDEVEALVEKLVAAIEDHPNLYDNVHGQKIVDLIDHMDSIQRAQSVTGGSILQNIMLGDYYLSRVRDEDKKARFAEIVAEEYISILKFIAAEVRREFTALQENGRLGGRETGYDWYRGDERALAAEVAKEIVYGAFDNGSDDGGDQEK